MKLRCIIVDDEPNAVNLLEMFIQQTTQWQLLAKCYDALEAMTFLKTQEVDFIFLDINMPHLSGMEMAALLPTGTHIVFTTAYSEYAADSYGFTTLDYLLKPITLKRFYAAVQKIEGHFARKDNSQPPPPPEAAWFFIKSGKTLHKVLLEDILFVEAEKEYAKLVTTTTQLLVYRRMKDIEEQLSDPFIRVHQSFIVNIARLDKIQDNHIFIAGRQIPVSDKFREQFMAAVRQRTF
ncbi:LytTR family DNA-binding domain-containing protein [uncultured Chitinophaga sp.]|jgi:Response regulator of the LytR/AlgR family|uniref:LytR/AlgR family response regulator transcription factor n=1 Tax=uncultured Chitinophaga sp. TaxID=339340 RepID=UPI00262A0B28|nr:LytTR family DNA-binding domain-containing protein [uncultured Chitinophaga sp.]